MALNLLNLAPTTPDPDAAPGDDDPEDFAATLRQLEADVAPPPPIEAVDDVDEPSGELTEPTAEEIIASLSGEIAALDDRMMEMTATVMDRDRTITELRAQLDAAMDKVAELGAVVASMEASLEATRAHLASLASTAVWEINFTGKRVYVAAADIDAAIRRFHELKPGVAITAARAAGVTLMV